MIEDTRNYLAEVRKNRPGNRKTLFDAICPDWASRFGLVPAVELAEIVRRLWQAKRGDVTADMIITGDGFDGAIDRAYQAGVADGRAQAFAEYELRRAQDQAADEVITAILAEEREVKP